MDFQFMLGVDISKEWFHVCVMSQDLDIVMEQKVENAPPLISSFIVQLQIELGIEDLESVYLVMEHTGIYVQPLVNEWLSHGGRLSLVAANKISEHLGLRPGKEDKTDELDARRIAEYGCRYADKLVGYEVKGATLTALQRLQRQREQLVDARTRLKQPLGESKRFDEKGLADQLSQNLQSVLAELDKAIKEVERQIQQQIREDASLKGLYKRLTSVIGIGAVTATELLIATKGFTDFNPHQAKAFARYAGCVPQRRQSGKKNRKARASKQSNQRVKRLLTIAARAVLRSQSELAYYYERKRKEGKPYLVVINALRNKLIRRLFAVVRNQVMYQKNRNLSLQQP